MGDVAWRMDSRAVHAQKRHADDNLESEQRLAKRFHLMNLEQNGSLYVPVKHSAPEPIPHVQSIEDSMQIDDTKDKIYIYNLDEELRDTQSDEEKLVFLPDIEKQFTKIPKSVLMAHNPPVTGSEMVLYNVPSSLSIPKEEDSVRRAIIETRARAREKQALDVNTTQLLETTFSKDPESVQGLAYNSVNYDTAISDEDYENAMDIG